MSAARPGTSGARSSCWSPEPDPRRPATVGARTQAGHVRGKIVLLVAGASEPLPSIGGMNHRSVGPAGAIAS
jgi:hypothetical protein